MKNRASNKIISLALAAVMMLGMFTAAPPMTAYAVDIGTGDDLTAGANLTGTEVYFGEYNSSPILWHVVATDSGTATLWTTTSMGNREYDTTHSGGTHQNWSGSDICEWLNGTSGGSFLYDAFTDAEKEAIKDEYSTVQETTYSYTITPNQKIVLPSVAEIGNGSTTGTWGIDESTRAFSADWWLRSPGSYDLIAAVVSSAGPVTANGAPVYSDGIAIRPAFKLNLSSVIFTSAAAGGKSVTVGDPLTSALAPTGAVKLTVLDSGLDLDVTTAVVTAIEEAAYKLGDTVSIAYTDATATADYISCVITEQDGTVLYYGKLDNGGSATGTASFTVPALDDDDYIIKLFAENCNGNYETDYASDPVSISLTVDNTKPTVTGVLPSGTGVSTTAASLALTFSEEIDITTAGAVTMSPNQITGTPDFASASLWDASHKVLTIPISGLSYGTQHTIAISGFEDLAGNVMDAVTSGYTFTTEAAPAQNTAPTINGYTTRTDTINLVEGYAAAFTKSYTIAGTPTPTVDIDGTASNTAGASFAGDTLTIPTGLLASNSPYAATIKASNSEGDATMTVTVSVDSEPVTPSANPTSLTIPEGENRDFTVYFGQGADEAASATVTSNDTTIAIVSPSSVNTSGSAITVTGVSSGTTTITLGWSGGTYDATTTDVDVEVTTAPQPTTYDLNVINGTGNGNYAAGTSVSISASIPSGAVFSGWTSNAGGSFANAGNLNTIFTMPANSVTLTANYYWPSSGGGSSGSDSGSSYTPTYTITTDKQPNLPKTATLTYSGSVKDGRLTFTVTKAMVQAALDKAGTDPDGVALIFKIGGTTGYTCQTVVIEESALDLLKSSVVKYAQTDSALFKFRFDSKAINQLDSQTTGAVSVHANPAKLNEAAGKLIGSRPAFDIMVQFKKSGTTYNVNDLGSGRMTRWIAYKPASGENTGNLAAVYVDKNGSPWWIDDSVYDNGWVSWTSGKLSVYGVGYKTSAPAFTDTANHWAKDYIDFAVSRGLISGTGTASFSPDAAMTRAVFLSALGKLSVADVSGYTASSFTDVSSTDPAMPYIEWAVANKIVSGVGDNKFAPDSTITREQMAVMMVNYAKTLNYTLPVAVEAYKFTDAASVSAYAKDAVTAVQQAGIIVGKGGGVFDPQGKATRAEGTTILRRFVELVIDPAAARGWVQNDSGGWMYYGLSTGKLFTGWQDISGKRYYFDKNGVMQAEKWLQIGGKWYYFQTDGTLAVDTKIDGYEVGEDGARK